jgi:hypothetical protein
MSLIITQPVALELTISDVQPAFQGLSSASSFIAADVTLTTSSQFYQVTTLSLVAGTWLVLAQCQFYAPSSGTSSYTMRVIEPGGNTLAESSSTSPSQATAVANANISALITVTSTTTITMQASASANSRTVRYNAFPGGTSNATGMVAVRIA